jgi:hypothetical protein
MKTFAQAMIATAACLGLLTAMSLPLPAEEVPKQYAPAQKLVDKALKDHPEVLVLCLHVTPPGGSDNVIIASRFATPEGGREVQRIGKKADDDDMRVVQTGKPNLEVNATGDRFEVEMPLLDKSGKTIGAISTVFPYKKGDNESSLQRRGEIIRDEFRKEIPSMRNLFANSK